MPGRPGQEQRRPLNHVSVVLGTWSASGSGRHLRQLSQPGPRMVDDNETTHAGDAACASVDEHRPGQCRSRFGDERPAWAAQGCTRGENWTGAASSVPLLTSFPALRGGGAVPRLDERPAHAQFPAQPGRLSVLPPARRGSARPLPALQAVGRGASSGATQTHGIGHGGVRIAGPHGKLVTLYEQASSSAFVAVEAGLNLALLATS